MTYDLEFKKSALKEWNKLDPTVQTQLKKKLLNILLNPHIPSARLSGAGLSGAGSLYKIKLRHLGYRLAYAVNDRSMTVTIISIGKREGNKIYKDAIKRMS